MVSIGKGVRGSDSFFDFVAEHKSIAKRYC